MPLLLPRRYEGINTKVRRYEGTKVPSFNEGNMQCNAKKDAYDILWRYGLKMISLEISCLKGTLIAKKILKNIWRFRFQPLWKSRLRRKVDRECLIPYLRWPINRDGNLNRGYINAKFSYVIKAAAMILFIMVLSSIWISLSSPRSRPSCPPRSNPDRFQRREPKRAV